MVKVADTQASDLGSIPGRVSDFFGLNSSNSARIMEKLKSVLKDTTGLTTQNTRETR